MRDNRQSGVSVLILTKNEASNIGACIDSVSPLSDDVVVLDSYSEDSTCEIAAAYPQVRVVRRSFDNWSSHSNWALENIAFKHSWVYYADADERLPSALVRELLAVGSESSTIVAYEGTYRVFFWGRWLKHGGSYPVWVTRLFRPESVRYEARAVNAHPIPNGSTRRLANPFLHYTFNKGIGEWFLKHNSYSSLEALEGVSLRMRTDGRWFNGRASARRNLKQLSFWLPLRGLLRFGYGYILRGGMKDGVAGLHYALCMAIYESWVRIKIKAATGTAVAASGGKDARGRIMAVEILIDGVLRSEIYPTAAVGVPESKKLGFLDRLCLRVHGRYIRWLDRQEQADPKRIVGRGL